MTTQEVKHPETSENAPTTAHEAEGPDTDEPLELQGSWIAEPGASSNTPSPEASLQNSALSDLESAESEEGQPEAFADAFSEAVSPETDVAEVGPPATETAEPPSEPWPPVANNGAAPPPPPVVSSGAALAAPEPAPNNDNTDDDTADEDPTEHPMTLLDHLGELRTRLVRSLLAVALGFFLCYGISDLLFQYLALPLVKVMPPDTKLIFISVPEGFFVYLKVAFVAGIFLASPYIFYQVWSFIAPGLYDEEKRFAVPLGFCSAFFFLAGASFCYFGVFPFAFAFFMSYSTDTIQAMPALDEYLSFSLKMLLAFGLIFEMPLFAFFLARMGIITAAWMRKVRKYAVLAVFVVAAVLTPPDVFSQVLMAVPMLILYEISIFVAASVGKRKDAKKTAANAKKDTDVEADFTAEADTATLSGTTEPGKAGNS